jgi:hypothetical protein
VSPNPEGARGFTDLLIEKYAVCERRAMEQLHLRFFNLPIQAEMDLSRRK